MGKPIILVEKRTILKEKPTKVLLCKNILVEKYIIIVQKHNIIVRKSIIILVEKPTIQLEKQLFLRKNPPM